GVWNSSSSTFVTFAEHQLCSQWLSVGSDGFEQWIFCSRQLSVSFHVVLTVVAVFVYAIDFVFISFVDCWNLSRPNHRSSSGFRFCSCSACDPPTQLMVPASFKVQETSTTSEYNVTLGSQDDCSALFVISSVIKGSESAQSQQHETITSDVIDAQTTPSENSTQATTTFIPTLGAWAKPLLFKPPATPPEPSTPRNYDPTLIGNQLAALWPPLTDEILNKKPKSKHPTRTLQPPIEKLPPPELKPDGSLRFPWAARLSPQSRNLYRATTPTYRMVHQRCIFPPKCLSLARRINTSISSASSTGVLYPQVVWFMRW
ncbi:unnamed protein product, partial [Brassica oleracea var. botrytis]